MTAELGPEVVELSGELIEGDSLVGELAAAARRHGVVVTVTFVPPDDEEAR